MLVSRWRAILVILVLSLVLYLFSSFVGDDLRSWRTLPYNEALSPSEEPHQITGGAQRPSQPASSPSDNGRFDWSEVPQRYPVSALVPLPASDSQRIPTIQHVFEEESVVERSERLEKLQAVKSNFTHAWNGYKTKAWLRDEVKPLSGQPHDPFGGWAATLVDSLGEYPTGQCTPPDILFLTSSDTLWIMELYDDFSNAVEAIEKIDFSTCALEEINVFETTIRYLGGFLSAYDLSGGKYPSLLKRATDLGEMLYHAFDTPNRMPITRWNFSAAAIGTPQEADETILIVELGSLTLEFTRLSQLTGDMRFYDAIQRIMDLFDAQQAQTKLPGMWPIAANAKTQTLTEHTTFTIGGMADSTYEYLPKQHLLLGGGTDQYQRLYDGALQAMKQHIFYRPMTRDGENIRIPGRVNSDGKTPASELIPEAEAQHLSCFAGGMVGVGAKVFESEEDLTLAKQLVEGCLWGYEVMPQGIMPEIVHAVPCADQKIVLGISRNGMPPSTWHMKGMKVLTRKSPIIVSYRELRKSMIPDTFCGQFCAKSCMSLYDKLTSSRPEAIESIFILYRITGESSLRDRAWNMFNTIIKHSITDIAHAGLDDCTKDNPPKQDRMESFWLAETLKYFYLIFSGPDVVSLDEYVFNTEAHPLRRPT